MDKYMSIITNFGCHMKCSYCIVKKNGIKVPATTLNGLDNLSQMVHENKCNIVSVSGGGDPLYHYEINHEWYRKLFRICSAEGLPVEMHTSYATRNSIFPFYDCARVVYHANSFDELGDIYRTGHEIVRVVFVVTENFTPALIDEIAEFVEKSEHIDELSFRQLVGENYEVKYHCHEYLRQGHLKHWHYIEQKDYNLYYVDGKLYRCFADIGNDI